MRVLIVRLGAFGDIVHTLPLAADLHAAGIRLGWVCEDRWSCLLRGNPAVETIHDYPRKALKGTGVFRIAERYQTVRSISRALAAERYDAVIDAQGLAKSALFALGSRAPLRIGHDRPRSRELAWVVSRLRAPVHAEHVIDQQRALGQSLTRTGPTGPWRFPLPAWSAEREAALDWMRGQGLNRPWMLNVGAGWPTKVWPRERQIAFVRQAAQQRRRVVLVWGSHDEHVLAQAILQQAGAGILAPPTTIPELAGLVAAGGALLSGDTGPLHLALALGTPAVGLFGPVPATRNGPKGRGYRTFQAPGAAWERKDVSKVDMGAITVEEVLAAMATVSDEGRSA